MTRGAMSDLHEGDQTLRMGLLMEAAQSQQRLAQASLEKLDAHARELDALVREEVRRTLLETVAGLTVETEQAADALRRLRRVADLRVVAWTVTVTLISAAVALGATRWALPSLGQIESLRARRAALLADIERLRERGAQIDLRRCGQRRRLCVRVDRHGPGYGAHGEYRLIEGE